MTSYNDEDDAPRKPRLRLMHFTMVMLCLLFVSKVTSVVTGANELMSVRDARASSKKEEPAKEAKPSEEKKGDGHGGEAKEAKEEMTQGAGKHSVKEIEALKGKDVVSPYTQSEVDLLQNLAKRREELDAREKELDLKSKVLDATEQRITDKIAAMKELDVQLSKVVAQYKQQQNAEIMSLVKIYENMKPLDAAAIFNEMDMPILLEVIDKMSERKVAPVLAGMDPRRARDVTQELAEMRRGRSNLNAAAATAGTPAN